MSRFGLLTAIVFCVFLTPSDSFGQFSEEHRAKLITVIESTAANFKPERLPDPESAKADFLAMAEAAEKYLQHATDSDNHAAWLQFLNLDPLY